MARFVFWGLEFKEEEPGEDDGEFLAKLEALARGKLWFVKLGASRAGKAIIAEARTYFVSGDGSYPRRLPVVQAHLVKVVRKVGKR